MSIVNDLLEAIPAYTGLSPAAFFTVLALGYALWCLISSWFAPPPMPAYVPREPPPPPVQLGDVTEEELSLYDGRDESKPLLMAIKGQIYDVSMSRMFYGPGGPYALFAGKDASRALAKMSFEQEDLNGNLEGLSAYELEALSDWEYKFTGKYVKVGQLKGSGNEGEVKQVEVKDASTEDEAKKPSEEVPNSAIGDEKTTAAAE